MRFVKVFLPVLVCVGLLVAAGTVQATVRFNGDFDTGDLLQWDLVQNCDPSRSFVYSHAGTPSYPTPASGTYAMRQQAVAADDWDDCQTSMAILHPPRAQVGSDDILAAGDTVYESWYVYVPTDFTSTADGGTDRWFVLQEDFGTPFHASPPYAFTITNVGGVQSFALEQRLYNGNPSNTNDPGTIRWSTPIVKGAWHRFVVRKYMSTADWDEASNGYVDLKFDGAVQSFSSFVGRQDRGTASWGGTNSRLKLPTMDPEPWDSTCSCSPANGPYRFYLNVYFGNSVTASSAVRLYFDEGRITTTLAEAEA